MMKLLVFIFTVIFGLQVFAAGKRTWTGAKRSPQALTMQLEDHIDRFKKEGSEFRILLDRHPAFYIFPVEKGREAEFEKYLIEKQKAKKKIKIVVDAYTREILEIID